jgi:hypothetical protein
MERPTEFAIAHGHLGEPEPDLGLTVEDLKFVHKKDNKDQSTVKVLIDGAPANATVEADLIKVKAPPEGAGPWKVVVITRDEKTLLGVLDLAYDSEKKTFEVKQPEAISDPPKK